MGLVGMFLDSDFFMFILGMISLGAVLFLVSLVLEGMKTKELKEAEAKVSRVLQESLLAPGEMRTKAGDLNKGDVLIGEGKVSSVPYRYYETELETDNIIECIAFEVDSKYMLWYQANEEVLINEGN